MSRGWMWLQLTVAWLPMWALFTALIVMVHGNSYASAALSSLRMIAAGALLSVGVYRFASRVPWPHPFRLRFLAVHIAAAFLYSLCWQVLLSAMESVSIHHLVIVVGPGVGAFMVTGIWLYIMVSGVAYANLAAQRTAMMEANAARMQLDTLRSQLHPHFLFNALHTIVQLIPTNPRAATRAAEQLASALRTTIEERRDLISLREEWDFVERYLAIESIRFGERLRVCVEIDDTSRDATLPSYSLQTLVENAVRHGAAPRVEPTLITISAVLDKEVLTLQVIDNGSGADIAAIERGNGTGLRRLRERLRWLYGQRARLELAAEPAGGFIAMLVLPQFAGKGGIAAAQESDDDE